MGRRQAAPARPARRARSPREAAEHRTEQRVPQRRLSERRTAEHVGDTWLAGRWVEPLDESTEREQRDVLAERKRDAEWSGCNASAPAHLFECEAEDRA